MLSRRVLEKLRDAKRKLENYVTCGQIHDYASYRFFVGEIKGLQNAIDICQEILKGDIDEE